MYILKTIVMPFLIGFIGIQLYFIAYWPLAFNIATGVFLGLVAAVAVSVMLVYWRDLKSAERMAMILNQESKRLELERKNRELETRCSMLEQQCRPPRPAAPSPTPAVKPANPRRRLWARGWKCCRDCGTRKRRHHGHGRCCPCYRRHLTRLDI